MATENRCHAQSESALSCSHKALTVAFNREHGITKIDQAQQQRNRTQRLKKDVKTQQKKTHRDLHG